MSRGPLVIMLVEDNPDDVELTTPAFGRHRLAGRFAVAADGAEALELLIGERATRLSLVMLDLKLPKGSGHEVLERIRTNVPTGMLSVILPTSSSEGEDVLVSYSSGALLLSTTRTVGVGAAGRSTWGSA
jgi:two-component system, response regulator